LNSSSNIEIDKAIGSIQE